MTIKKKKIRRNYVYGDNWDVADKKNFSINMFRDDKNEYHITMAMTDWRFSPPDERFWVGNLDLNIGKRNDEMFSFLLNACKARETIRELEK